MSSKDGWLATRRLASPPPKSLVPTMPTRMLIVVSYRRSERTSSEIERSSQIDALHGTAAGIGLAGAADFEPGDETLGRLARVSALGDALQEAHGFHQQPPLDLAHPQDHGIHSRLVFAAARLTPGYLSPDMRKGARRHSFQ